MRKTGPFLPVLLVVLLTISYGYCFGSGPEEKQPVLRAAPEQDEIPGWKARWELARILSYTKRYDESVVEYKKLLAERPRLYEAKAEMAKVLFWQGKRGESLSLLEEIPAANIDDATRMIMADLYAARKDYDRATVFYRAYLEKHPEDLKARLKLAETLSWNRKYDESIAEYGIILDRLPDDIQVRRKYAYVLMWAKRYSDAAKELRKTLK